MDTDESRVLSNIKSRVSKILKRIDYGYSYEVGLDEGRFWVNLRFVFFAYN